MKTLLLLRHAKSSWKDSSLADHERPLNRRGRTAAPRMGLLLSELQLVPDQAVCSTAVRATSTCKLVCEACRYDGKVVHLDELYLATAGELLRAAETHGARRTSTLLMVAHNPGMESLVSRMSGQPEGFPTGALAAYQIEIAQWSDLELGATIRSLGIWRPRDLDAAC